MEPDCPLMGQRWGHDSVCFPVSIVLNVRSQFLKECGACEQFKSARPPQSGGILLLTEDRGRAEGDEGARARGG